MAVEKIVEDKLPDPAKGPGVIVVIPAFNEAGKIERVVKKIPGKEVSEILVVDDGSTDGGCDGLDAPGVAVLRHETRQGIGAAIGDGLRYALDHAYEIVVVMAGNDKDEPAEVSRLVAPLLAGEADYVQGSRYLRRGHRGKMPKHRLLFTRLYSLALSLFTLRRVTDGTNGFRAYRSAILKDPGIDVFQDWLKESLEYYLSIKVLKLGYRYREVPVTKLYPQGVGYKYYTKVRPFSGWIERLKPLFFLTLGIKK